MSVRESTAAGPLRLPIRVVPGARRSEVVGRVGDVWKLRVHAAPERGRANAEVVELLARTLGVPRSSIRIVHGRSAGDKLVEVEHLSHDDVERRLAGTREDA